MPNNGWKLPDATDNREAYTTTERGERLPNIVIVIHRSYTGLEDLYLHVHAVLHQIVHVLVHVLDVRPLALALPVAEVVVPEHHHAALRQQRAHLV